MMLTQQMSVLAHDLASHCRVAALSQGEEASATGEGKLRRCTSVVDTEMQSEWRFFLWFISFSCFEFSVLTSYLPCLH